MRPRKSLVKKQRLPPKTGRKCASTRAIIMVPPRTSATCCLMWNWIRFPPVAADSLQLLDGRRKSDRLHGHAATKSDHRSGHAAARLGSRQRAKIPPRTRMTAQTHMSAGAIQVLRWTKTGFESERERDREGERVRGSKGTETE
jgi:hypothetical protein